MLTVGKIKKISKDLASPVVPLSKEEFTALIRESEEGPFYSIDEVAKKIAKWRVK